MEEIYLEKNLQRYIAKKYPDGFLASQSIKMQMRKDIEQMATTLVLMQDLPTEPLGEWEAETDFYYPKNWWQMFKDQVMPDWFKKRFPVQDKQVRKKVTVQCGAVYPKLNLAMPEKTGDEIRFAYQKKLDSQVWEVGKPPSQD